MHSNLTTLKNGLRIITSKRPDIETVSMGLWVRTGAAYEKPEVNGISHFLEHMAFKGTQKRTALQISEDIENVGGQSNAYTSREFTSYFAKMLKEDTELGIDVLTDIIQNSAFPEEELKKEQEVVVQEIKQTLDTPDDIVFDYFQEAAFPNQAVGRSILGPEQHIRDFTKETLQSYLKTNYAAENMVFCAVGNIDHEQAVKMVEERMAQLQPKTCMTREKQLYHGGSYTEERKIEQAHMVLGFRGVKYTSEDYYTAVVLSSVLGGGMASRLFQEVREKRGLVYNINSFSSSYSEDGIFGIYAATDPKELKKMMPVIINEIKKICNEKVSQAELKRAQTQIKASMLMSVESSSHVSEVMARQLLIFGRVIPLKEIIDRIESVTAEEIQNQAQDVFRTNPTYTLLGAIQERMEYDELQKQLKA